MEELRREVGNVREKVSALSAKVDAHESHCEANNRELHRRITDEVASQNYVRDAVDEAVKPLNDTIAKLGAQISRVVLLHESTEKRYESTEKRFEELYATQNEMMKQRNERERQESEARVKAIQDASNARIEELKAASWQNVGKKAVRNVWVWLVGLLLFGPSLVNFIESLSKLGLLPK